MESLFNFGQVDKQNSIEKHKISSTGKILLGVTGGLAVGLTVICAPFISPALRKICLPYVPATTAQVKNVLKALEHRRGTLIDLGSGDGRIVLEAVKHNFTAHGVELNLWLVIYSKLCALKNGLSSTKFFHKNLWHFGISDYDNVVIFGVEEMMQPLESKILKECKNNCNIVACRFPLPTLAPKLVIGRGIDRVWLYEISK